MANELIISFFGLLGTGWAGWLTYRGSRVKAKQDLNTVNFVHMQKEIDRLREDLATRDTQARATYSEVIELRRGLQSALIEIHELQLAVSKYSEGSKVLYFQLVENDITPKFRPAGVGEG